MKIVSLLQGYFILTMNEGSRVLWLFERKRERTEALLVHELTDGKRAIWRLDRDQFFDPAGHRLFLSPSVCVRLQSK
jgi:hypothetical protein